MTLQDYSKRMHFLVEAVDNGRMSALEAISEAVRLGAAWERAQRAPQQVIQPRA